MSEDRLWRSVEATAERVAERLAREFRIRGLESEDVKQISRLACLQAARTWRSERGNLYGWMRRHARFDLISALIASGRRDARILISTPVHLLDWDPVDSGARTDAVVDAEDARLRLEGLRSLCSSIELTVLDALIADPDLSYREISEATGRKQKSVDNALCRLRRRWAKMYPTCPLTGPGGRGTM